MATARAPSEAQVKEHCAHSDTQVGAHYITRTVPTPGAMSQTLFRLATVLLPGSVSLLQLLRAERGREQVANI